MSRERNNILAGLKSLLQYHKTIGIDAYPRNDDIEAFLQVSPRHAAPESASPVERSALQKVSPAKERRPIPKSTVKITDIAEEVASCHACELHKQRLYPVSGRGSEKIRLLIVGDWLAATDTEQLPAGHLFGVEQDKMLGRMLTAINLSGDDVFITNVIKCAVPHSCQPQASHVQSCVSYLRRQIAVLRPEIICTMGMVAARAILENPQPLSRLRGQFLEYEQEQNHSISVIATYHPSYLLQNPEMKQATWADLQLLAKRLMLKPVA